MNLRGGLGGEQHPVYQMAAAANTLRQYDFLDTMIRVAVATGWSWLSIDLIKALNYHAIVGLHYEAGRYRSHEVSVGNITPPSHYEVAPRMDDLVNWTNRAWDSTDTPTLAANALWRINLIHPFVNGNGRTARAVCYFILCVKAGGPLPGRSILPEVLRVEPTRSAYVQALRHADQTQDLGPLAELIRTVIMQQIGSSGMAH